MRALFVGPNGEKIRIAGEVKDAVMKYLDEKVKEAVDALIAKLPTKSKGKEKGQLKRVTIKPEDLE
ncbi:MAG: hypothetical protein Kow0069_24530 [Promethearchaeota archaeon]